MVFDLDFTLWDAGGTWCDHTTPPYSRVNAHIEDAEGRLILLYPEVREILDELSSAGIPLAVASRTYSPETAHHFMELFGIRKFFEYEEIYPSSKVKHFSSLQAQTGIPFDRMYFFDDEPRNIQEVGDLGVNVYAVNNGLTRTLLEDLPTISNQ